VVVLVDVVLGKLYFAVGKGNEWQPELLLNTFNGSSDLRVADVRAVGGSAAPADNKL
jgi:hypothetical protein